MDYKKIISVSGLPGLYEMQSQKGDGVIVNCLKDKTTKFLTNRIYKVTPLESIEIFTMKENVNLNFVFKAMKDSSETLPEPSDKDATKKYFEKVYPDMDFERVYFSDMKKMIIWFKELKENDFDFEIKEEEPPVEQPAEEPKVEEVEKPKEKPKTEPKEKEKTTKAETKKKTETTKEKEATPKKEVAKKEKAKKEEPKETKEKKTAKKETETKEPAKKQAKKK